MGVGAIDVLIILILVGFGIRGYLKGFVFEVIGVLGIVLSVLFTFALYPILLPLVNSFGFTEEVGTIVTYFIGFFFMYLGIILFGHALHKLLTLIHLGWLNRLSGFFIGALKSAIIVSFILWVTVKVLDPKTPIVEEINKSTPSHYVMMLAPVMYEFVDGISGLDRVNPFEK